MPSRTEIREAAKAAFSDMGISIFTGRTVRDTPPTYAVVQLADVQSAPKYISDDTSKEFTAQLQIVIYVRTDEDDSVLEDLADQIETKITASQSLNSLLDELEYRGFEEVDDVQGYEPLALIFDITYQ